MKSKIHLIPTTPNDETAKGIWIRETRDWCNIYITSDEEIKEGDWVIDKNNVVYKQETDKIFTIFTGAKKIILTTDQDLIKDGVRAIHDEFLEWFVKNSSCEEIEVVIDYSKSVMNYSYKIIIPKEEPKQENFENLSKISSTNLEPEFAKVIEDNFFDMVGDKTLEEAAKLNCQSITHPYCVREEEMFVKGAKWQAERMYSEEEVKSIINTIMIQANESEFGSLKKFIDIQFEQFKKK